MAYMSYSFLSYCIEIYEDFRYEMVYLSKV